MYQIEGKPIVQTEGYLPAYGEYARSYHFQIEPGKRISLFFPEDPWGRGSLVTLTVEQIELILGAIYESTISSN